MVADSELLKTISLQRISLNASVSSKKKALQLIAELLENKDQELDQDAILEALSNREKMGSTALEKGVALPHCRVQQCTSPMSALLTLKEGIDFDARDQQPVKLLWALIVPAEANAAGANERHLELLAQVASVLGNETTRSELLNARVAQDVFTTLNALTADNTS